MTRAAGDTIVALSSGRLPAAIAVIRTSGPAAFAAAQAVAGKAPASRRASLRHLRGADGALIDRGLVLFFPAPDSATGEDIVEYQCHGSKAVVAALIAALTALPAMRSAEPGEFTRRALANGRIDLTQAEGLAELLEAESEAQRISALRRAEGGLRRQIEIWRGGLLELSAEAEVAIDYADEEDGAATFDPAPRLAALIAELDALLAAPRVERLRDGVRLVVAGPPNVGKSSLVNALAGESRAIVTDIAGTTRDIVEVPLSIGGIPLTLVDTAGLRETGNIVERIGVGLAEREIERADLLLWLGTSVDQPKHPHCLLIASKADQHDRREGHRVSVIDGEGLDTLVGKIILVARSIIPTTEQPGLNEREAALLAECRNALSRALTLRDPVLVAEEFRLARGALDRVSGITGVDELLDALFGRFCLGK
ncbi:MAG: tRNA uridine-5-carboxymethylaminomethyl(34) synthesis GTPase MnmE [Sphingomonas bacterium]|nr:tRNA uridine-5-carboxymethylaminomethyl(34) synthesis GTPase MnmE [Sphingomonas bacterium]